MEVEQFQLLSLPSSLPVVFNPTNIFMAYVMLQDFPSSIEPGP